MDGSSRNEGLDRSDLEPIAIIGASCRMPGAPNLDAFEQLVFSGADAVGEVPDSRWAKYRYLFFYVWETC